MVTVSSAAKILGLLSSGWALLSPTAGVGASEVSVKIIAPPPPTPPKLLSPPSLEAIQRNLADDHADALRAASKSGKNITRNFYVEWEMHHGYFLVPVEASEDAVVADFADNRIRGRFDRILRPPTRPYPKGAVHLLCKCSGVWVYEGDDFLIRSAKLEWSSTSDEQSARATKQMSELSVCDAVAKAPRLNGKTIVVAGDFRWQPHGALLLGRECPNEEMRFAYAESFSDYQKAASQIRSLLGDDEYAPVHVVVRGVFRVAGPGECFGLFCERYKIVVTSLVRASKDQ